MNAYKNTQKKFEKFLVRKTADKNTQKKYWKKIWETYTAGLIRLKD
jgi:hypothetical protein